MKTPVSMEQTVWATNPCSWREAERLADVLQVPMVVAMVLAGRGLADPAEARMFIDCAFPLPDPFLFGGMKGSVQAVSSAIDRNRKIVVHGDYDADGITATALMVLGLRSLGAEVDWYLPNRFDQGYGLSRQAVEALVAEKPGLLITVDCGVNYPDEVALARERGVEVVVVDHHQPGPRLPDCHLIHQVQGDYPHGDLCGVGLALKLMHGLHIHRNGAERTRLPEILHSMLDLVAVGTIADLAPLKGENRHYVREGLKLIGIGQRVGLRALAAVSGCEGTVDSGAVAFRLAPRLNAAGRLAEPSPPLRLLLTEDEAEAKLLAAQLHDLNTARQDLERQVFDEAVESLSSLQRLPPVLVLAAPEWHEGVVGIVAARIVERYHRPTVLLCVKDGVAKGSARSVPAYNLLLGLTACERFLTVYGGHAQAAGLTLDALRVDELRLALEAHAGAILSPSDLRPAYRADAVIRGEEIGTDAASALASLEPFGCGNPRPRLLLVDASLRDAHMTRNGLHMRCRVEVDGVTVQGIGFAMGALVESTSLDGHAHLLGAQLTTDAWQGTLRPELVLEYVGSTEVAANEIPQCGPDCPQALGAPIDAAEPSPTPEISAKSEEGPEARIPVAHDLRDRPGRFSALAQVIATQERAVLFTCSIGQAMPELGRHVPLGVLSGGHAVCLSRLCAAVSASTPPSARVVVAEWEAGPFIRDGLAGVSHAIALDPPFRSSHLQLLSNLANEGATIHLLYGDEERKATKRLLRYILHPRFAMVSLFRAMQEGIDDSSALYSRARSIAWEEAGVLLTAANFRRARDILLELGVARGITGKAKLDAGSAAAYREAEADYEECLRLCLTL